MNTAMSISVTLLCVLALSTSSRAAAVAEEQQTEAVAYTGGRNQLHRFESLSKEQRKQLEGKPLTRKEKEVVAELESDLSKIAASAAVGAEFGGDDDQSARNKRSAVMAGSRTEGSNSDEHYNNCVLRQCVEVYNWCFQNCYGIIDFKIKYRCLYHICPRNLQICVQYCDRIREHWTTGRFLIELSSVRILFDTAYDPYVSHVTFIYHCEFCSQSGAILFRQITITFEYSIKLFKFYLIEMFLYQTLNSV